MSIAGAIGVISGGMGIWEFIANMIPEVSTSASDYRVYIGLDGPELSNAGGYIETVKTYNIYHELIGAGEGGNIGDGDNQYGDFSIEQHGNMQSIWTEFCKR
ncbi:hypothetical protein SLS62_007995 [Diatrype stigma]|uniref:Uncharacterized protein n=1 Tax=Diatrype stigma TaxID=117547 RepID=A0AAN9UN32_9PEZI